MLLRALWLVNMHELLPKLIGTFGLVFLFGFSIFIHELGHFLVAKLSGVGVSKFALGFGPKIVAFVRGGTEYSIRWLPLGGFVALKGMIEGIGDEAQEETKSPAESESESPAAGSGGDPVGKDAESADKPEAAKASVTEDLDALRHKHPAIRLAVFTAGVACNYLTAIVVMALYLAYGARMPAERASIVESVPETSQLYALGWRSGDRIVGVEPQGVPKTSSPQEELGTWYEVEKAMNDLQPVRFQTLTFLKKKLGFGSATPKPPSLTVTVQRKGERVALALTGAVMDSAEEMGLLYPDNPPLVRNVASPNSPAGRMRLVRDNYTPGETIRPYPGWDDMPKMPLESDDLVLEVNHEPVKTWTEMTTRLRALPGESITLTVQRGPEKRVMLLATTLERNPQKPEWGQLGIYSAEPRSDERDGLPLGRAILRAPMATLELTDRIVYQMVDLFYKAPGREIKRNLGGPVAIAAIAYESAQRGLEEYLRLFVAINIILAIMNLLPIPILDGGYILITAVETVIRRPIPQQVMVPLLTTFMVLFIVLFGFLFYNDFMNLIYRF